jgi:flagellar motor switch protein FliM
MVELLAPQAATRKATTPLSLRRHAVTPERVRIEAMLGDAEVSLHDFVHLSAGDVIVLDQSLSRGGRLVLSDGQLVAPVVLGRAGERRAVSIATQSEQRSEHS